MCVCVCACVCVCSVVSEHQDQRPKVHNLTASSTDLYQDYLFFTDAIKHLRLKDDDQPTNQPTKFSYHCTTTSLCFIFYQDHFFYSHMQRGRSVPPARVYRRLLATVSRAWHSYCYQLTRTPLTLTVVAQREDRPPTYL